MVFDSCRFRATADTYKMIDFYDTNPVGAQITFRNCRFYGTDSWVSQRSIVGRNWRSLAIENCTFDNTRGMEFWPSGSNPQVTRIRYNRHNNVKSDGTLANVGNFIQLRVIGQSTQIEIAWNEIVNTFPHSWGEDMMSIYHTSNCWIHDNLIDGIFNPSNTSSSQGGITIDASDGAGNPCANCIVEGNMMIGGLAMAVTAQYAGNDNNIIRNNRNVNAGRLPDGTLKQYGWGPAPYFFYRGANRGDQCYGNYGNCVSGGGMWSNDHAGVIAPDPEDWPTFHAWGMRGVGDNSYAAAIAEDAKNTWGTVKPTLADEATERVAWAAKVAAAGVTIGSNLAA